MSVLCYLPKPELSLQRNKYTFEQVKSPAYIYFSELATERGISHVTREPQRDLSLFGYLFLQ